MCWYEARSTWSHCPRHIPLFVEIIRKCISQCICILYVTWPTSTSQLKHTSGVITNSSYFWPSSHLFYFILLLFIPIWAVHGIIIHSLYSHLGGTWHYLLNEDNYVELNKLMYIALHSQRCFKLVYEKYANGLSIFQKHFL